MREEMKGRWRGREKRVPAGHLVPSRRKAVEIRKPRDGRSKWSCRVFLIFINFFFTNQGSQ